MLLIHFLAICRLHAELGRPAACLKLDRGEQTHSVAKLISIIDGRISRLRRELYEIWQWSGNALR